MILRALAFLLLSFMSAAAQTIPQGMDVNGVFNGMNARNAAWAGKADVGSIGSPCPIAASAILGCIKPDGTTTTVGLSGILSVIPAAGGPFLPLAGGTVTGATTFSGALTGALTGHASLDLPLTGGTVTGATTFSGALTGTLTGGASLDLPLAGGTVTGATTFGGTLTVGAGATLTNVTNGPTLSFVGNATTLSNANPVGWLTMNGSVGGTVSGSTQSGVFASAVSDGVSSTTVNAPSMWNFVHNIAPNGTTASGGRITLNVTQSSVGVAQGGSYTNNGFDQAVNFVSQSYTNEGGTSTAYEGVHITGDIYCILNSGATFLKNCTPLEYDLGALSGSSYIRNNQATFVHLVGNAVLGLLGPDIGITFSEQAGAPVIGYKQLLSIGNNGGNFPTQTNGAIVYANPSGASLLSTGVDTAQVTYSGCFERSPYEVRCTLHATGITSATRLTTDGNAASSYVYQANRTNIGSGYTTLPAVTLSGSCNAVVNASLGSGSVVQDIGVNTPGTTGCLPETTMTIATEAGATATGTLTIAGNSLNLPINSTNFVRCDVSLSDSGPGSIGWTSSFIATMGATASTTALNPSTPTWTAIGTDSAEAISAAADTSNGAINITITPTAVTANVGATCTVTSSVQVI